MSCFDIGELSRIATTGEQPPHLRECLECRRELEHQRGIRDALRALPAPRLGDERRRALKAETLAAVGQQVTALPMRRWIAGGVAAAAIAAAAAAALLALRAPRATSAAFAPVADGEPIARLDRRVARDDQPPARGAPILSASPGAVLSDAPGEMRDVLALADGSVEVDTRGARDVDVRVGRTVVRVVDASVRIRAHDHAIVSVQVVVGSARVIGPDQQLTLQRDTVWTAQPPATATALSAFRDAWVALRTGRDRDAIALFDRATDPSVAEEASYWAAVAAMRAGDAADAKQRFSDFLARFPSSPYADKARAALK